MTDMRIGQTSTTISVQNNPNTGGTTSSVPPADSLLSDPTNVAALGGDPLAEIAALLSMADNQDRNISRTMETTQYAAEAREDAARVQAMYDKASATRSQGWAEGAAGICEGLCGFGAGVTTPATGKLDLNDVFVASAKGFEGAGRIVGQQYAAAAVEDDAQAASHEAAAKSADHLAQQAHQDEMDARDALKKVADFLQAVRSGQNSASSAATSYRG